MVLEGASVLVTGGTGSFGRAFVKTVLARYEPRRVIVYCNPHRLDVTEVRDLLASLGLN